MKHTKIKVLEEFDWIKARPTIYLGSTEIISPILYFSEKGKFEQISYIPALHKIFDEILENSVDEFIRTKGQFATKIDVVVEPHGTVTVSDNGRGLEIEKHEQFTDKYIPEVIFTKLRSGSNFEEIREGIGVNGLGAVLTVLFSKTFTVRTYSNGKRYTQDYDDMLSTIREPKIVPFGGSRIGTEITFTPNFEFFKTKDWNRHLLRKKIIDLAFAFPNIKFTYNNEKITAKKYKEIVNNYSDEYIFEENDKIKLIVCANDGDEFRHHSSVNGANTFLGGPHIEYISSEIVNNIRPVLEKKFKLTLKPADIKNHLAVFCQLNIENPIFSGQTKEQIINKVEQIKPTIDTILDDKFYKKILKNEPMIIKIIAEAQLKQEMKELGEVKKKQKEIVKRKVAKLIDANSKFRDDCILFLTEGDSASASANIVRNTEVHAFLPLRGKILNIFDLTPSEVLHNSEIQDILNATGLKIGEKPTNIRFGKICLLTDEDEDGSCIKGLLINLFYKYWKELFEQNRIVFLKTPLYIAEKNSEKIYIYDKEHLEELKKKDKLKGYKVSYFKGLGGLTSEDWEYFLNKSPQYVTINNDKETNKYLEVVFGESTQLRKDWLRG